MGSIRIGVSGWSYGHWRGGAFYPEDLPQRRELDYLSCRFNAVEINGSFYSLLRPRTYQSYLEVSPADFLFAVKGNQFITHAKKLKDIKTPLANFFASGVLRLEKKLGPVLWQFPRQQWDVARVESFLRLLPRDSREASRLASKHDQRLTGRSSYVVHANRRLHHALEFRHVHFLSEDVVRMCRRHGAAIVFSDSGDWPYTEEITAGFVYLRLHGSPHTYASDYGDRALDRWAQRIRAWADGREPTDPKRITPRQPPRRKNREVHVYFDNDNQARAPRNALALMKRLEVEAAGRGPATAC
jgi:uncharacterized protein YecE (DUF72 family)